MARRRAVVVNFVARVVTPAGARSHRLVDGTPVLHEGAVMCTELWPVANQSERHCSLTGIRVLGTHSIPFVPLLKAKLLIRIILSVRNFDHQEGMFHARMAVVASARHFPVGRCELRHIRGLDRGIDSFQLVREN